MIYYGFCGRHFEHELHVIHEGAKNIAGAGTHWCIGWSYSNAFDEVRRSN